MKIHMVLVVLAGITLSLFVGACSSITPTAKEFTVYKIYGDHMVLQQRRPIQIGGQAAAGEYVKVTLDGNHGYGQADQNGEWLAVLPPMEAGGPYTVTVSGAKGSETVVFKDVLIGEVWLASGQSNMEMPVFSGKKYWSSMNGQEEAAKASNNMIRFYNATSTKYVSPTRIQKDAVGPGWQVCSPETAAPFSAVGYYFARQLQQDLKVPVGIVSASWGGTAIQPWISTDAYRLAGRREALQIDNALKNDAERDEALKAQIAKSKQEMKSWEARFYSTYANETAAAAEWKNPDFDDSDWKKISIVNESLEVVSVGWYRKAVELPADWAGKPLTLSLGAVDDCDETYFNGVRIGATGSDVDGYWSVKRKYQVPAGLVKAGRNVIAVRVSNLYGGGGLQGADNEKFITLNDKAKIMLSGAWAFKIEFTADTKVTGIRPEPSTMARNFLMHPSFPSTLFNSLIAPWTRYQMRGFLWYQGEANAGNPQDYIALQRLLISDWRRQWWNQRMPFLLVQLSGFEKHTPGKRFPDDFWQKREPGNPAWAAFREAQAYTLTEVPFTGMAVSIDAGDHSDIHPANKQVLGYRLAREAERLYGYDIVSAGPYYESMKIDGDKIILSFTNVGSGLMAKGDKLTGFAIAGKDGKFVWADAEIKDDKVVVSSPQVKDPVAARYGWVSYAENLNFYNKEDFPASPFRTDRPAYILYNGPLTPEAISAHYDFAPLHKDFDPAHEIKVMGTPFGTFVGNIVGVTYPDTLQVDPNTGLYVFDWQPDSPGLEPVKLHDRELKWKYKLYTLKSGQFCMARATLGNFTSDDAPFVMATATKLEQDIKLKFEKAPFRSSNIFESLEMKIGQNTITFQIVATETDLRADWGFKSGYRTTEQ